MNLKNKKKQLNLTIHKYVNIQVQFTIKCCLEKRGGIHRLGFLCLFVCLMVFNATFNNISAISCRSVLLLEEAGGP
jgi:hypothetical protein